MFATTPQFLPQHRQQRRQVLGNLDQIIAALETQADTKETGAADAR